MSLRIKGHPTHFELSALQPHRICPAHTWARGYLSQLHHGACTLYIMVVVDGNTQGKRRVFSFEVLVLSWAGGAVLGFECLVLSWASAFIGVHLRFLLLCALGGLCGKTASRVFRGFRIRRPSCIPDRVGNDNWWGKPPPYAVLLRGPRGFKAVAREIAALRSQ